MAAIENVLLALFQETLRVDREEQPRHSSFTVGVDAG